MTYFTHNDAKGQDARVRLANYHAARERMLMAFREYDLGAITLFMSKRDLQVRLRESAYTGANLRAGV